MYRYKKGKKEIYLKDDSELGNFLIETGINSFEFEGIGNTDLMDFFKIVSAYKNILKELEKRFAVIAIIRHLIENPDLVSKSSSELFEELKKFIETKGYNLLNHNVTDDLVHLYIQTGDGLEELKLDDNFFTNPLYEEALFINGKLKERDLTFLNGQDPIETLIQIEKTAKKGAYIQRYKGLGEMNPEQLWETTMNPENRRLLQVKIDNYDEASDTFTLFMGDEVEPRRNYIQAHAKDVKHLDV